MEIAALRAKVEQSLQGRISSPFAIRSAPETPMASSGIGEIDALTGGLPRGCVTEVCGEAGAGRSSFLVAVLAVMTRRKEFCALVDGRSSFDPRGAAAVGAVQQYRGNHERSGFAAAWRRIWSGGGGFVRSAGESGAADTAEQLVPVSANGGEHADGMFADGAAAEREVVRVIGAEAGDAGDAVERRAGGKRSGESAEGIAGGSGDGRGGGDEPVGEECV